MTKKVKHKRSYLDRKSVRVDALPGETERQYRRRCKAMEDAQRRECGGKTYDEATEEYLEAALADLR